MASDATMDPEKKKAEKKAKRKQRMERLKLGSHFAIERFGVFSAACAVTGALIVGGTLVNTVDAHRADISATALYTPLFESSRTRATGEVAGLYTNADQTRVLVMMHVDDPLAISDNAEDYYALVSGIDGADMTGRPTGVAQPTVGSIYTFGDTGYLGVLLEAPQGFGEQLVNITMRMNSELQDVTPMNAEERAAYGYGESFVDKDQWRVVINPGATGLEVVDSLEGENQPDPRELYADLVLVQEEVLLRQRLMNTAEVLQQNQKRVEEQLNNLEDTAVQLESNGKKVKVVPPVVPDYLVGDKFNGLSRNEVSKEVADRMAAGQSEYQAFEDMMPKMTDRARYLDTWFVIEGGVAEEEPVGNVVSETTIAPEDYYPSLLNFQPARPIPGGINFNWQNRTIADDYLSSVVPEGKTYEEFVDEILEYAVFAPEFEVTDWNLTNGKKISDYDRVSQQMQRLINAANGVSAAYSDYYASKAEYSTTLMSLLELNYTLNNVAEISSVNTGAGADAVDEDGNAIDVNSNGVGVDVQF